MAEKFILHETQDSMLCGQHCLNNLLQQSIFTPVDLAQIGQQLDEKERECLLEGNDGATVVALMQSSAAGNVDATGNFSLDVLNTALARSFELELVSWTGAEGRQHEDPTEMQAFVINREHHWYTIRKIGEHWWNLDSMLDKPEHISPFYLSALLAQLRNEGCMVFLVQGNVPAGGDYTYSTSDNMNIIWHAENSLLTGGLRSRPSSMGDVRGLSLNSVGNSNADDEDDELQLAMALSLSMTK
jgi:ataxin-3